MPLQMRQNTPMQKRIKNVQQNPSGDTSKAAASIKHLTLRLPCSPVDEGVMDESAGLTRLRAIRELMSGKRYTIHGLLTELVDDVRIQPVLLPYPKSSAPAVGAAVERIDVRLNQDQLDLVDSLRDQMLDVPGVPDPREYYKRPDVVRELIKMALVRAEAAYAAAFQIKTK